MTDSATEKYKKYLNDPASAEIMLRFLRTATETAETEEEFEKAKKKHNDFVDYLDKEKNQ